MLSARSIVFKSLPKASSVRHLSRTTVLSKTTPDIYNPQVPKEIVSGAPEAAINRIVKIYKPAKPATQSSNNDGSTWRLDFDIIGKSNRWENDLMGWQGTGDIMNATTLRFDTKDSAVRFAEGQGWDYYVTEPKTRKFRKKDYSANFYHSAGPLKHIRTK